MTPFIRPAGLDDLPHLIRFSKVRTSGITSLPQNEGLLEKNLRLSEQSFRSEGNALEPAYYLFCLQYGKKVIGVSGIKTAVGLEEPFFVYQLTSQMQKCSYLQLEYELEILNFQCIKNLPTEVGSLFLEKAYRKRHFGRLLSYCRFLFIVNFPNRFSNLLLAQLRGVNVNQRSPFWDAVGNKFFGISFQEAELLRSDHPDAIAEIFPRSPIYPTMLPQKAQEVIRTAHKNTIPARMLLEKEGFQISPYLDIFDAGPHMYAARDSIHSAQYSKLGRVCIRPVNTLQSTLIANTTVDFRAVMAPAQIKGEEIRLAQETAALLNAKEGDTLRYL